ncbi:MAG: cellulase family glycosylhydrolase [Solirubrobacteraceae bacterium]|nr:cellulase family glycosylhydrolase [Solirubrobacteraceae bacterium]
MAAAVASIAPTAGCGADDAPPARPPIATVVQDDAELLHRSPARIAATFDDMRDIGVDWVRVTAGWSVIAPEPLAIRRPAFDARDHEAYPPDAWSKLDRVYELAHARGMRTAIDIAFWAPRWAVARPARHADRERDTISVADYAAFATAVARRYPRAAAFTVWNEPNHNAFFLPQWERTSDGWQPAAPHLYRAMVQAAVPAIKAAAPDALVLIGATSSVGSARATSPDERMAPLTFLRELACVDERLRPLDRPQCRAFESLPGDGWSHHPYSLELAPWQPDPRPDNVRMADLDRLTSLLRRLHESKRTVRSLPLYLTEWGYQTNPPDPTQTTSLTQHARWMPEAERIARRQSSLRSVSQFLIRDLPERPGRSPRVRWGDYQSGLRLLDGSPKPAHASFSLALVAHRAGAGRVRFWGLVRPGTGSRPARISVREPGGGWRAIARLRTREDGTFERAVTVDPARTFRLESGGRHGAPVDGAR